MPADAAPASRRKTPSTPDSLSRYWSVNAGDLIFDTGSGTSGLTSAEAAARLLKYGRNTLEVGRTATPTRLFIHQFANPLVLILLFAVGVSVSAGEWTDAAVITAIVVGSALISFIQEYSAGNAVARLRSRLTHYVTALRDGQATRIPADTVVPGDIVLISAGTLIPADGAILSSQDCFINQAVLTGETFPVEKSTGVVAVDAILAERTNCVFMGTSCRSGTASVLIVRTGEMTEFGNIADRLSLVPPETEFERGIRKFGLMLARVMVGLVVVVFAFNVISHKPPIDSLLFAIALAVGISPELLPAIITINLSKGAREMAHRGVIVRRLPAIENLGSMDVLCADKTGTLTEGVVRLDGALDIQGKSSKAVRRLAYLNAHFQTGIDNPLDEAIRSGEPVDVSTVTKLGEVPYDFGRKRLSVVVRDGNATPTIITKGALDNVLAVCSRTDSSPITDQVRVEFDEKFKNWSEQGFRVLGVATKEVDSDGSVTRGDEEDMCFAGFLLFFDPPKPDVKAAIDSLENLKVSLKVITGDNRHVAAHVAESVGLPVEGTITGSELNELSNDALLHRAEHTTLFVEVDPNQKERIIRALQKMGHVVGYMGDGINDAPALHEADVGISVDGAVDVAREAADFIILEKGLDVLSRGIVEGRRTFANSLKYVFTTTSANFGNMFSMAGASAFLPFLPLLAKQVLLNNFLSDIPAIAIAGDNVDREYITHPHRWNVKFIRSFMIVFGLISSIFDFLTFGVLIYVVHADETVFHTGWFIESLLTELLVALVVRTRRHFYQSKPSRWLWISTAFVSVLTIALPYAPGVEVLGFVPLPPAVMALILVISFAYVITTEIVKTVFYRHAKVF